MQIAVPDIKIDVNYHLQSFNARRARATLKQRLGLEGRFLFIYTYPLTTPARIDRIISPEMTPVDIMMFGVTDYKSIYDEETRSSDQREYASRGLLLNRGKTNGTHGIWGHEMSDLYFEGITIDVDHREITFSIGS